MMQFRHNLKQIIPEKKSLCNLCIVDLDIVSLTPYYIIKSTS